jgi:phage protein D
MAGEKDLKVKINGSPIPVDEIFEIIVDMDVDQPDMCFVTCTNIKGQRTGAVNVLDTLEVDSSEGPIFIGEVIGMEPTYDHTQPSRVQIRGLNKMHRLARGGRKSRTFENMTDQDMVSAVCQDAGLTADCDSDPTIVYDHVYMHNMTGLEFIRQRAARLGYGIKVWDSTLYFKKRDPEDCGVNAKWGGGDGILDKFKPRLHNGNQVSKVICKGWDPIAKKEIIGQAEHAPWYGDRDGASAIGEVVYHETERPIFKKEEADAVAQSVLRDRMMTYVMGWGQFHGEPKIQAGKSLTIDVDDGRFGGTWFIAGCRHRYVHSVQGVPGQAHDEAGYRTLVRLLKDATDPGNAPASESDRGDGVGDGA